MQRFTELKVWQLAHATVLQIYNATQTFPHEIARMLYALRMRVLEERSS